MDRRAHSMRMVIFWQRKPHRMKETIRDGILNQNNSCERWCMWWVIRSMRVVCWLRVHYCVDWVQMGSGKTVENEKETIGILFRIIKPSFRFVCAIFVSIVSRIVYRSDLFFHWMEIIGNVWQAARLFFHSLHKNTVSYLRRNEEPITTTITTTKIKKKQFNEINFSKDFRSAVIESHKSIEEYEHENIHNTYKNSPLTLFFTHRARHILCAHATFYFIFFYFFIHLPRSRFHYIICVWELKF